jgi:hypothetical protein
MHECDIHILNSYPAKYVHSCYQPQTMDENDVIWAKITACVHLTVNVSTYLACVGVIHLLNTVIIAMLVAVVPLQFFIGVS